MAVNETIYIETGLSAQRTFLKNGFARQPYKLANITEDKKDPVLRLMLMSASPGILDKDAHRFNIHVSAGTTLQLYSQSYQRLYHMEEGAVQHMEVSIQEGGSFFYIPHPIVPHDASSFTAHNSIRMEAGCTLLFGEVITCGRKHSGESFMFSRFHNSTEIFYRQKLVMKENILIEPALNPVEAIGQLEGYTHQSTLIFLDEKIITRTLIDVVHEKLSGIPDIEFGITAAPFNGIVLRMIGHSGEQLFGLHTYLSEKIMLPFLQAPAQG